MEPLRFNASHATAVLTLPSGTWGPTGQPLSAIADDHRPTATLHQETSHAQNSAAKIQHLPVLDTWRGTAVTLLLIGHFVPFYRLDCGALGVEFFFVLSGFLMGRILFVKQTPLAQFYQSRISRILPAAYVYLFCILAYLWYVTAGAEPSRTSASSYVLFYMNYFAGRGPTNDLGRLAGHFWSLCVEGHCYVVLSGLALLHRKKGVSPLLSISLAILACFAMSLAMGVRHDWDLYKVYWRSDCRGASVLCGALAACLVHLGVGRQTSYLRVPSIVWGMVAVGVGVGFRLAILPQFVHHTVGTIGLTAGLLLVSQHAKSTNWAFPPLVWLGTISFSLYLWQQPFYIAAKLGHIATGPAIVASLICGVVSYFVIERPVRLWINQRRGC